MATEQKTYQRKLSDEEAQGQYILVLKNGLDVFPKPGKPFSLMIQSDGETKKAEVMLSEVPRWSVGPSKPKNSYKIDLREFRSLYPLHFGKKIVITKTAENEYTLS
ncbi:hypothetical protein JW960_28075 [candidate division KSB1 bacterium]|nr:hypothetical protein [candidate division KSB1 bacterium]